MLTHPTTDELSAFSIGQLANEQAAIVENHIGNCETCCETLLGLESKDSFLGLLRQAKRVSGDQTVGLDGVDDSTASNVPAQMAEHPRYEILGLIGKGGMGDVFKARHRMMERMVALKVIKHELVRKPEAVDRFHREVKTAASLSHPNIVTAHDADHVGDVHFLVMEFVEGVNLDEVVRQRGPLPVDQAADYIRQAAAGLQHAHEQGMVHRDIKPHNLMLTASGEVKILDFGLASFVSETVSEQVRDETPETLGATNHAPYHLTQAGTMMGTPDYIAPEQATDAHAADIRSDIYSLGCTFYTLLVGHAPFGSGSVLDKIKAHREQTPPPLSDLRDDVPPEVEAILHRMLAKNPSERFQSPADVVAALSEYCRDTAERTAETAPRATRDRRRPWALLAVATLLAAVVVASTIIYIQTDYGVVRVEVADESLQVKVNGRTIEMKDGETPLSIRAGEQTLIVRRGDFKFETDSFHLRRGGQIAIKVELIAGAIMVHKDGARFAAKALPDSDIPKQAEKNRIVVTLRKDDRYLLDDRPVDDAVELVSRIRLAIELNPDRDVVVVSPKEYGIRPVKDLVLLILEVGGKRVLWPDWVPAGFDGDLKRTQASNQIGEAMHKYLGRWNYFPPAKNDAKFDVEGQPVLSWRVHLLPYLGQGELYKKFRLDQPWDHPHNKALLAEMPAVYKTIDEPTKTTFLAVVGAGTAYEGKAGLRFVDLTDGPSYTALVVDAGAERAVPWTKPEDLPLDREDPIRVFGTPKFDSSFLALLADGSTLAVAYDTAPEGLRILFTRADGNEKLSLKAKRTTPLPVMRK